MSHSRTFEVALPQARLSDYMSLTKPRLLLMVLLSTLAGYYLASPPAPHALMMTGLMVGMALAAGGALALNQYLERDVDARMKRTCHRALPEGRLQPEQALMFGTAVTVTGLLILALGAGLTCAVVTLLSTVGYLFVYTPLKRRSPLCTLAGAVPGALPPVAGWAAARGTIDLEAWILFAILFLWQMPHSLAIAQMYRADYERAGLRLLPVIDPQGRSTDRQIFLHSMALLAVGLLPTLVGLAGVIYFWTALALGMILLGFAGFMAVKRSNDAARRLMLVSLVYLPVLLAVMTLDKVRL
ncbi:MAG: heme o synthase [Acidobacteria bacterium]|nr:heme o synthase [Acidobacteriota bacterium]